MFALAAVGQLSLCCPCGSTDKWKAGLCRSCYYRISHSRRFFGGHRDEVLKRDGGRCQLCGASPKRPHVHHRRRIQKTRFMITLCAACHAKVHRTAAHRRYMTTDLFRLWKEQHPDVPEQLQMSWEQSVQTPLPIAA